MIYYKLVTINNKQTYQFIKYVDGKCKGVQRLTDKEKEIITKVLQNDEVGI